MKRGNDLSRPSIHYPQPRLDPPTLDEHWERTYRMGSEALRQLSIGPLGGGLAAVFTLGAVEGATYLRPAASVSSIPRQCLFVVRYAVSQILPSLIWHTQPVQSIADLVGLDRTHYVRTAEEGLPTHKQLRLNHLRALRGAIAGSVMLTQLIALTGVWAKAHTAFGQQVQAGKEPPLVSTAKAASQPVDGVVIRLAGKDSDVTAFSMAQLGRRKLWPIFEEPQRHSVQALVDTYATASSGSNSTAAGVSAIGSGATTAQLVPIFWHVPSGAYGQPNSWKGMNIPRSWLFEVRQPETGQPVDPILILEADATPGDGSSLSMTMLEYDAMDFDLHEAAQAFHQIAKLAPTITTSSKAVGDEVLNTRVVRVMLVDCSLQVQTGGGSYTTVGDVIRKLRLADVTIDSKPLVSRALKEWLDRCHEDIEKSNPPAKLTKRQRNKPRRFVLETPNPDWFRSLNAELSKYGYEAVELSETKATNNSTTTSSHEPLPVLVYGKSSADTVYTIRALLERGLVDNPRHVCALLSGFEGLRDLAALRQPQVGHVCSSELYDAMFAFVRAEALKGRSTTDIQAELDAGAGFE